MSESGENDGPLLVGYDGSEQSRDALELTRLLAPQSGGRVVAVAVITFAPAEASWAEFETMQREELDRLEREVRAGLADVGDVTFRGILAPSPARELHTSAVEVGAGLIVLGSTHRGPVGRVLPGSVADRMLSAAPCPIAVAPRGYRNRSPRIGAVTVAFDGSPESKQAIDAGSEIAASAGASVRLLSVSNPDDSRVAIPGSIGWSGVVTTEEGIKKDRERMRAALQGAVSSLDPRLCGTGDMFVSTHPADVIAEATEGTDLLVMGSRGYGPVGRVLLGGVASNVIRRAACPVIVTVRTEAEG